NFSWAVFTSHSFTVRSTLPEATSRPSALTATVGTNAVCPLRVARSLASWLARGGVTRNPRQASSINDRVGFIGRLLGERIACLDCHCWSRQGQGKPHPGRPLRINLATGGSEPAIDRARTAFGDHLN